jgi:hypothetical protein
MTCERGRAKDTGSGQNNMERDTFIGDSSLCAQNDERVAYATFEKERKKGKLTRDISMNEFFVIPLRRLSTEKADTNY